MNVSHWTQDLNLSHIRRSEDVLDVFWMSYERSVYVLHPRGYVSKIENLAFKWARPEAYI